MGSLFERYEAEDVRDLVADYPLAWVTTPGGAPASLLPLLGEYDAQGRLVSLLGHMARRNPLHAKLAAGGEAYIHFTGPHAYISPTHAGVRDWGPTWNYARLSIRVEIVFHPEENDHALATLVKAMEGDRWSIQDLGGRYEQLASAIIAFRAQVREFSAIFKLGQDERPEVFASIIDAHPDQALVSWMKRFRR